MNNTWNQFAPEILELKSLAENLGIANLNRAVQWPRAGSHKEQAKIELARRLVLEDKIRELQDLLHTQYTQIDELKDKIRNLERQTGFQSGQIDELRSNLMSNVLNRK